MSRVSGNDQNQESEELQRPLGNDHDLSGGLDPSIAGAASGGLAGLSVHSFEAFEGAASQGAQTPSQVVESDVKLASVGNEDSGTKTKQVDVAQSLPSGIETTTIDAFVQTPAEPGDNAPARPGPGKSEAEQSPEQMALTGAAITESRAVPASDSTDFREPNALFDSADPGFETWQPDSPMEATVSEDITSGSIIAELDATDQYGSSITYTITDSSGSPVQNSAYVLDGNTIRLSPGAELDFEADGSPSLYVVASNEGGTSGPWELVVTVADVSEHVVLGDGGVSFVDHGVAELSVEGGSGDDVITAHDLGGELHGGAGADILVGLAGDDVFQGEAGNDIIEGGMGVDVAVFSGNWSDYTIIENDGTYLITDNRAGSPDGTDIVVDVELFRFTDGDLSPDDAINVGPSISAADGSVSENSLGAFVSKVTAFDLNQSDTVTLSVDDSRFEIVDGQLKLKDGEGLDFEVDGDQINVTVTATDTHGASETHVVSVAVNDEAEAIVLDDVGENFVDRSTAEQSIQGGSGHDTVLGGDTDALIHGGGGNDVVTSGQGNDTLSGGQGHDVISAGSGDDLLTGGAGDDTINAGDGQDIAVFSGNWSDYSVTESNGAFTLTDNRPGSPDGVDVVVDVEIFRFADGDISISDLLNVAPEIGLSVGQVEENASGEIVGEVLALDANDRDTFTLSVDDDRFEIVAGNLKLKDGESLDFESDGASHIVNITATDSHGASTVQEVTINIADVGEVHRLENGTLFDDMGERESQIWHSSGNQADYIITNEAGSNVYNGKGKGDTTIIGRDGNDKVAGGYGDNYIDLGGGNDTLWAQRGNDTVFGGDGNDRLLGDLGNDFVDGGDGNDTVNGGTGHDTLYGGAGNDTMVGGSGNDTIDGGEGLDVMIGDAGHDLFLVSAEQAGGTVEGGTGGGWTDVISLSEVGNGVSLTSNGIEGAGWTMVLDGDHAVANLGLDSVELSPDASGTITFDEGGVVDFVGIERIEF